MNIELKPCPFCGGDAVMTCRNAGWTVDCTNYQAKPMTCRNAGSDFYETPEEAAQFWNRRPLEDALRVERDSEQRWASHYHAQAEKLAAEMGDMWTPIENGWPNTDGIYIGWDGKAYVGFGYSSEWSLALPPGITHWMPMPKPPEAK